MSTLILVVLLSLPETEDQIALNSLDSARYFRSALVHYEGLNYERAIEQLKKSQLRAKTASDQSVAALMEGVVRADWGQLKQAEEAFSKGFGTDLDARLPVDASPKIVTLAERVRSRVRRDLFTEESHTSWQPSDACGHAYGLSQPLWNEAIQARVFRKLQNSASPEVTAIAQGLINRMNAWVDAWVDQQLVLCLRRDLRQALTLAEVQARERCLAQDATIFATLIESIDASPNLDSASTKLASSLPDPLDCGQVPHETSEQYAAGAAARTWLAQAWALLDLGDNNGAGEKLDKAVKASASVNSPLLTSQINECLGRVLKRNGDIRGAVAAYREAVATAVEAHAPRDAIGSLIELITLQGDFQRDFAAAHRSYDSALRLIKRVREVEPLDSEIARAWGGVLLESGKYAEALTLFKRVLRKISRMEDTPSSRGFRSATYSDMAIAHYHLGNHSKGTTRKQHYRQAVECFETAHGLKVDELGINAPNLIADWVNLAGIHMQATGEFDKAEKLLNAAVELGRKLKAKTNGAYANLGQLYFLTNRLELAKQYLQEYIDWVAKTLGPQHREIALSLSILGDVLREMGQPEKAVENHLRVLGIAEQLKQEGHPEWKPMYDGAKLHLGLDFAALEDWGKVKPAVISCNQAEVAQEFDIEETLYCEVLTSQLEWEQGAKSKAVKKMRRVLTRKPEEVAMGDLYCEKARVMARQWLATHSEH